MRDERPVLLFGAGGFAADVHDLILAIGGQRIVGCVVDVPDPPPVPGLSELAIHHLELIAPEAAQFRADAAVGGIGAVVIDRVSIGADCFDGAGALVTRDFDEGRKILGRPGRAVAR